MDEPARKIAQVTAAFWVMKVLATTLGETAGDYLSMTLGLGYAAGLAITGVALAGILAWQIATPRLRPGVFWAAIVGTTTAGTEVSDFLDRSLGVGYLGGALLLVAGLLGTLALWYALDHDLDVQRVRTKRSEVLFWIAVVFSNSLGTAFGDYLVDGVGLSFLGGSLVTAVVIAAVAALHWRRAANETVLFWVAFVFTRPFGATFGDLLTKGRDAGGLALPRDGASAVTLALLVAVLVGSERRR